MTPAVYLCDVLHSSMVSGIQSSQLAPGLPPQGRSLLILTDRVQHTHDVLASHG